MWSFATVPTAFQAAAGATPTSSSRTGSSFTVAFTKAPLRQTILLIGFLLCLLCNAVGCSATPHLPHKSMDGAATPRLPSSTVTTPSGDVIVLELALDPQTRARGMMGRREAPSGTGMLFVFDHAERHSFWMFQCLISLDIIWLDEFGTVVHVGESLPPCKGAAETCPMYGPDRNARYVLEIAGGTARGLGIVPGARLLLSLPAGLEVR